MPNLHMGKGANANDDILSDIVNETIKGVSEPKKPQMRERQPVADDGQQAGGGQQEAQGGENAAGMPSRRGFGDIFAEEENARKREEERERERKVQEMRDRARGIVREEPAEQRRAIDDIVDSSLRPFSSANVPIAGYGDAAPSVGSLNFVTGGQRTHDETFLDNQPNVPVGDTDRLIMDYLESTEVDDRINNPRQPERVSEPAQQPADDADEAMHADDDSDDLGMDASLLRHEPYRGLSTRTFPSAVKEEKEAIKSGLADKHWTGNGFNEKATASDEVDPIDISIGSQVVRSVVREPGNDLIDIVNEATGSSFTIDDLMTDIGMQHFKDVVNSSNIDVVATKSPVTGPSDTQRRRLRIHDGRGIRIHRTQTVIYNLDFDGDNISISFDIYDGTQNAMRFLINVDGKAMIDTKFFPLSDLGAVDKEEFVEIFKMIFLEDMQNRGADVSLLAEAMYLVNHPQAKEGQSDSRALNDAWCAALREIERLADAQNDVDSNIAISSMLKDVYDNMKYVKQQEIFNKADILDNEALAVVSDITEPLEPIDHALRDILSDMSRGTLPPNFQDFMVRMEQYIGRDENGNSYFRIGAKFAKGINFNKDTFKGESGAHDLYSQTLAAGLAMFMNDRTTIGERMKYIQRIAKHRVFAKVKFPAVYRNPNKSINMPGFLVSFKYHFNRQMRIHDAANVSLSCEMDPLPDPEKVTHQIRSDKLRDIVQPLLMVYGDVTVEKMFPFIEFSDFLDGNEYSKAGGRIYLLERYRNMTLREFAMDNHIIVKSETLDKDIRKAQAFEVLLAIADKRTSAAAKYQSEVNTLNGYFEKAFKRFSVMQKDVKTEYDRVNFEIELEEMISALHLSGVSMFHYFNMDNVKAFFEGKFGQLFQNCATGEDADGKRFEGDFGGIRMMMVYEYRMRRVDAINGQIDHLLSDNREDLVEYYYDEIMDHGGIVSRINDLQNRLQDELNTLASSSDLWKVLVDEVYGNNEMFLSLKASKGECLMRNSEFYDHARGAFINWGSSNFWSYDAREYNSLTEVMRDPNIPQERKMKIATDVVRLSTGCFNIKNYEMLYQLDMDPDPSFTSPTLMAYREQPSVISDIQEANNRLERHFERNWRQWKDDVAVARVMYGDKEGYLDNYITAIADNPELYLGVSNEIVAAAIEEQMDPSSQRGEKAHQEITVNGFYNLKMEQIGGMTDSMYRTDARTVGAMPVEMLSMYDVLQVIAHPERTIWYSDGSGVRKPLSREILFGDDSERALWDALEKNPRLAMLLRPSVASSARRGTVAYRTSEHMFSDAMTQYGRNGRVDAVRGQVKSYLTDRTMFLSMVAMFVPIANRRSGSVHSGHADMVDGMQKLIVEHAWDCKNGRIVNIPQILEDDLGVTVESLMKAGMHENEAENWYADLGNYLQGYIYQTAMKLDGLSPKEYSQLVSSYKGGVEFKFDYESIALAQDCWQTFTGAKTETSTAIEGNITTNYIGIGLFASAAKGIYEVINGDMPASQLLKYAGGITNVRDGNGNFVEFTGQNIDQLEELMGDSTDPIVVRMPDGMVKQDETLDRTGPQITTLGRFISVKRSKGAEEFNLQAKKTGVDDTDSVTKTMRYDPNSQRNMQLVNDAYESGGLFAAHLQLAQILQSVDNSEGFDDMDLSDYMDLASIMIKEVVDEGSIDAEGNPESAIIIRGIGEIAQAIRRNADQSIIENGSLTGIVAHVTDIADNVNMESVSDEEIRESALYAVLSMNPLSKSKPKGMMKHSESSAERNYEMLFSMTGKQELQLPWEEGKTVRSDRMVFDAKKKEYKREFDVWSEERLNKYARTVIYKKLSKEYQFDGWKPTKGKNFYCPINLTRKNGESIDNNVSPGMQSVWILESGCSEKDIEKAVTCCYTFGMTLAFKDPNDLGKFRDVFAKDIQDAPFGNDYLILPFFSMRLNGAASALPMAPATGSMSPTWLGLIVEDDDNFHSLADSELLTDGQTMQEIKCGKSGVEQLKLSNLFYTIMHNDEVDPASGKRVRDMVRNVRFATKEDILRDVIRLEDGGPSFDIGISVMGGNGQYAAEKFALQRDEYIEKFNSGNCDVNGFIRSKCRPDEIVAWVRCEVGGHAVYAPVIPFPTGSTLTAPTRYDADISMNGNTIDVKWDLTESPEGQLLKLHMGDDPSAKSVTMLLSDVSLGTLRNGMRIDHILGAPSNVSRRLGWGPRMGTLKTLAAMMQYRYGFNIGDLDGFLPDFEGCAVPVDQLAEWRNKVRNEFVPITWWSRVHDGYQQGNIKYSSDPDINALVAMLVGKCLKVGVNPSDLFIARLSNGTMTNRYVDYDFFFRSELEFQDALMSFYHEFEPEVCPPSIEDYDETANNGKGYLFKPVTDHDPVKPHSYGCLQLQTPVTDPETGQRRWRWNNCYYAMNFFNDEYTAMHKPGMNGASTTLEAVSALSIAGLGADGEPMRQYAKYAAAPSFKTYGGYELHLDRGRFVSKER